MESKEKKHWKNKIGICMVVCFFGLFGLIYVRVFCFYWSANHVDQRVFGATYMTMNNQFYKILNNELQTQIERNGDHLITLDPALNQVKQNEQIEYLVKKKVDAIFLNPVDWKKIRSGLKAAKKAHIPIIVIDAPVYDKDLVDVTIVSDNYRAGVQCAKDMMKRKKNAKIALLTHIEAKSAVDRIRGFTDTIEGHEEYQVIASTDTQGQIERSLPKVEKLLKQYQEIDVIMALNDPAAMGALAALDSQDRLEGVLVYGIDGSPEAKKLIENDMMTGTSAQFPKKMGRTAIETAYKILKGENVKSYITTPVKLITSDNIDAVDIERWQ